MRAAFDHLGAADVVEQASLVAGVVEEGTAVPRLDDPAVADCLEQGLGPRSPRATSSSPSTSRRSPRPRGPSSAAPATRSATPDGEPGGRFDLLLLRRDRAVSFALVAVLDAAGATPLDDLVAALDAPLALAAARLN